MPIVLITLMVGIGLGYWLCRMQLRGKWILAEEAASLPPSWCRPEDAPLPTQRISLPLSQEWNLPRRDPRADWTPPKNWEYLHPPRQYCPPPEYTAATVIGDSFYEIPPDYPGGIEAWKEAHPMKGRRK
jgi:hypothetical protein